MAQRRPGARGSSAATQPRPGQCAPDASPPARAAHRPAPQPGPHGPAAGRGPLAASRRGPGAVDPSGHLPGPAEVYQQ